MTAPTNPFFQEQLAQLIKQPTAQSSSAQQSPQLDSVIYYERPDTPRRRKKIFTPQYKERQHMKHLSRINGHSPNPFNSVLMQPVNAIDAQVGKNMATNMMATQIAHALDRNMQQSSQMQQTINPMNKMPETNLVANQGQVLSNLFTSSLQRHQSMPIQPIQPIQPTSQSIIRNFQPSPPSQTPSVKLAQMSIQQQLLEKQNSMKKVDLIVSQGVIAQDQNVAAKKIDQGVANMMSNGVANVVPNGVAPQNNQAEAAINQQLARQITNHTVKSAQTDIIQGVQPNINPAQQIPQQIPPLIQPFNPPTQTPLKTQQSQQSQVMVPLKSLQSIQSQKSVQSIPRPPQTIPIVSPPPNLPIPIVMAPQPVPIQQANAQSALRQSRNPMIQAAVAQHLTMSPIPVPPLPISHQKLNNVGGIPIIDHQFQMIPNFEFGLAMDAVDHDVQATAQKQALNQFILNSVQNMNQQNMAQPPIQGTQQMNQQQVEKLENQNMQKLLQQAIQQQNQMKPMNQQSIQVFNQAQMHSEQQMNQLIKKQLQLILQQQNQQNQQYQQSPPTQQNQQSYPAQQIPQTQPSQPPSQQQAPPATQKPPAEVIQKVKYLQSQIDRLSDQLIQSQLRDSIRQERLQSILFAKQKELKKKQLQMEQQEKLLTKLRKQKDQRTSHIEKLRQEVERLRKTNKQQNEMLDSIKYTKQSATSDRKPWQRDRRVDFSDDIFPKSILRSRNSSPENVNFISFAPDRRQYVVVPDQSVVGKLEQLISPVQPIFMTKPQTVGSLPTTMSQNRRIIVRDYETARVV